jgi:mannose-1-phosphate guanylyltransferase / mannose-6-phosphate isomerase
MPNQSLRVTPVILCGGAGTRLWPSSREAYPKQFLPLIGERSTFELTLDRVADPALFDEPVIVTSELFRFLTADQLSRAARGGQIILEPARRDSAPAIAIAAHAIAVAKPGALMLVLAADHLVRDVTGFVDTVRDGVEAAANGAIVTFGITPSYPATGYGYVAPGAPIDARVNKLERFIEKPDAEKAKALIAAGNLWNSGNFLFRADVFLDELQNFEPAIHAATDKAVKGAHRDNVADISFIRVDVDAFKASPSKSVDYAVMEPTKRTAVVAASYDWSDLGSWDALWESAEQDSAGNASRGSVALIDTKNSYVWSDEGVTTAVVGLSDIVVVTTQDAVLVGKRSVNSEMKKLVETLGKIDRSLVQEHTRSYRPWGWVQAKDGDARHQVKRIFVKPGQRISMHRHLHRSEHWVVVKGTASARIDDTDHIIRENQSFYIPLGTWHQLANEGKIPLEVIEIRSGSYLGEDDIIRKEGESEG